MTLKQLVLSSSSSAPVFPACRSSSSDLAWSPMLAAAALLIRASTVWDMRWQELPTLPLHRAAHVVLLWLLRAGPCLAFWLPPAVLPLAWAPAVYCPLHPQTAPGPIAPLLAAQPCSLQPSAVLHWTHLACCASQQHPAFIALTSMPAAPPAACAQLIAVLSQLLAACAQLIVLQCQPQALQYAHLSWRASVHLVAAVRRRRMGWTERAGRAPESVGMCWQGLSHTRTAANLLLLRCIQLLLLLLLLLPLHVSWHRHGRPTSRTSGSQMSLRRNKVVLYPDRWCLPSTCCLQLALAAEHC